MANLKELHSNFVFVLVDEAANNVRIIHKRVYTLVKAKELGFNNGKSNDKTVRYDKIQ